MRCRAGEAENPDEKSVISMELTPAHLRYLLAIYEVSQTHLDICSRSIAEKLNVTKPSVVRIMNLLMDHGILGVMTPRPAAELRNRAIELLFPKLKSTGDQLRQLRDAVALDDIRRRVQVRDQDASVGVLGGVSAVEQHTFESRDIVDAR